MEAKAAEEWFHIKDARQRRTPALVIYKDRMERNIDSLIAMCGDANRYRPHVKTNKIREICEAMMDRGITKFKCATVAELQMLCEAGARDVLFAYPLVGANIECLMELQQQFPHTNISFLIDNIRMVPVLDSAFREKNLQGNVFIDVNVGMNRTGCLMKDVAELSGVLETCDNLHLAGFHAYDGHIHDGTLQERCNQSMKCTEAVRNFRKETEMSLGRKLQMVIAGTPTFACYLGYDDIQVSPGTFVFWDYNYKTHYPELPFDYAALLLCRVISVIDAQTVCLDAGSKAVASEMPLPRLAFLNLPFAETLFQSEEHLVVKVKDTSRIKIGEVIYGVPAHICPTVALYDAALVVENQEVTKHWKITARNRS